MSFLLFGAPSLSKAEEAPDGGSAAESPAADPLAAAPSAAESPAAESPAAESGPPSMPFTVGVSAWTRLEVRSGYQRLGLMRAREEEALAAELAEFGLDEPYWARFGLPEGYWRRFPEGELQVSRARMSVQSDDFQVVRGLWMSARLSPQFTALWRDSSQGESETALDVYEGYVRFKGEHLRFTLGRFAMNYGEGLVIGNLGWHQSARAFDGIHLKYELDRAYFDSFAATEAPIREHDGSFFVFDRLLWGAYLGVGGFLSENLELEPYFLGRTLPAIKGATLLTPGLRIRHKLNWFDYRIEADAQFGRTDVPGDVRAGQVEAEVGVSPLSELRLGLGGVAASADDPSTPTRLEGFIDLYPTGHRFLGLSDVFGPRRNALAGFFNLSATANKRWSFMMAGLAFRRFVTPEGASPFAGIELDSQVTFKPGKYTSIRTLYAIFLPNDGHFRPEVSGMQWGEPAHFLECQGGIEF